MHIMQGRRQRGAIGVWPPFEICVPPFQVWSPGCCIHLIQYFKNVAPLLLNPGGGLDIMSTNLAKTLVWKHEYDVIFWRHKQRTLDTNDHHMPLNETPQWKFYAYATGPGCVRTRSVWAWTQKPRWHWLRQLLVPSARQAIRLKQRRILIFGALGYFKLGALLEGSRRLMSYTLALYVSKLFQFTTILLYCEFSITKKPAVKLSGNTPITYLLSSLYNCTVCKCQELALKKAPVLLTTPNSLLLFLACYCT